jgi:hypothetical protein
MERALRRGREQPQPAVVSPEELEVRAERLVPRHDRRGYRNPGRQMQPSRDPATENGASIASGRRGCQVIRGSKQPRPGPTARDILPVGLGTLRVRWASVHVRERFRTCKNRYLRLTLLGCGMVLCGYLVHRLATERRLAAMERARLAREHAALARERAHLEELVKSRDAPPLSDWAGWRNDTGTPGPWTHPRPLDPSWIHPDDRPAPSTIEPQRR